MMLWVPAPTFVLCARINLLVGVGAALWPGLHGLSASPLQVLIVTNAVINIKCISHVNMMKK